MCQSTVGYHLIAISALPCGNCVSIKIDSSMTLSHLFYADDACFIGEWSVVVGGWSYGVSSKGWKRAEVEVVLCGGGVDVGSWVWWWRRLEWGLMVSVFDEVGVNIGGTDLDVLGVGGMDLKVDYLFLLAWKVGVMVRLMGELSLGFGWWEGVVLLLLFGVVYVVVVTLGWRLQCEGRSFFFVLLSTVAGRSGMRTVTLWLWLALVGGGGESEDGTDGDVEDGCVEWKRRMGELREDWWELGFERVQMIGGGGEGDWGICNVAVLGGWGVVGWP
ncbi:hypothetical protein Tco_0403270 [Tanacetum coccineum]